MQDTRKSSTRILLHTCRHLLCKGAISPVLSSATTFLLLSVIWMTLEYSVKNLFSNLKHFSVVFCSFILVSINCALIDRRNTSPVDYDVLLLIFAFERFLKFIFPKKNRVAKQVSACSRTMEREFVGRFCTQKFNKQARISP